MQIIFDSSESAVVGYKEISGDFSSFDFSNKMVVEPGNPPRMLFQISMSGDGLGIKAE